MPSGKPSAFTVMDSPAATEDGLYGAGVGDLQCPVFVVPESEEHDHILRIQPAFLQRIVERGEHGGRRELLLRGRAHDAADQRGE